jgi:hypothetical protein
MRVPKEDVLSRLREKGFIEGNNQPRAKLAWVDKDEWEVGEALSAIRRGYQNYYSFGHNPRAFADVQYLLQYSCAKTLCRKQQCSLKKLFTAIRLECNAPKKRDDDRRAITFAGLDSRFDW